MEFKWHGNTSANVTGIGNKLRLRRLSLGLSIFALAHELGISVSIIEAIETEAWHKLPNKQESYYVELISKRLELDAKPFLDYLNDASGNFEQDLPNYYREPLEKILVSAITVGFLALLCWLVIPGPSLKKKHHPHQIIKTQETNTNLANWLADESNSAYPLLGGVLPEMPVNTDGVLISMRAMDACEAMIKFNGVNSKLTSNQGNMAIADQKRTLVVSEPWCFRAKGPFTIYLSNPGVVTLEVSGRRIALDERHASGSWVGNFGANGNFLVSAKPKSLHRAPIVPETDQTNVE